MAIRAGFWRRLGLALLISGQALGASAGVAADSPWERGVFVFDGVLYDFGRQSARFGRFTYALRDCTDEVSYCVDAGDLSLVLPRVCPPLYVGVAWSSGPLQMEILAQADEPQGHLTVPGRQVYFVGSSARPNLMLVYGESRGIQALLFAPGDDVDFYQMAKRGEITAYFRDALRSGTGRAHLRWITTYDAFAPCRPSGVVRQRVP